MKTFQNYFIAFIYCVCMCTCMCTLGLVPGHFLSLFPIFTAFGLLIPIFSVSWNDNPVVPPLIHCVRGGGLKGSAVAAGKGYHRIDGRPIDSVPVYQSTTEMNGLCSLLFCCFVLEKGLTVF